MSDALRLRDIFYHGFAKTLEVSEARLAADGYELSVELSHESGGERVTLSASVSVPPMHTRTTNPPQTPHSEDAA